MALAPGQNDIPDDRRGNAQSMSGGVDVAEYIAIDPDPDEIVLVATDDGGALVEMPGEAEESEPPNAAFYDNLAEIIPEPVLNQIASDLLRRVESDKQDRELRDKQYAEGLRRTGMGGDAPGGAEFEGASRAVHPMLTEACIDYEARIIKELFPPSGPVKPKILGAVTAEKSKRANRIAEHMNYQITTQIKEARSVLETTLTQVPLGGSQFIHLYWDHRLKRPKWEFRSIDNMFIPASAADFASSPRKTYVMRMTGVEYRQRVDSGMYRNLKLPPPSQLTDPTKSEAANRKIQGVEDSDENLDDARNIFEVSTYIEISEEMADILDIEEPGGLYPYVLSIDETSKQVLSVYRCWEDGDPAHEPIEHDFEFPFLPWRGALSVGFPQVIGGLSATATGALRALLDSAHASNAFGGLMAKGAGVNAQTVRPQIGTFTEVEVGLETDDIRKKILPFSPTQPSEVLFKLLGFVVDAAKGVVRTTLEESPMNANTPVPVGTQLSRVEEGLVVFSAVHGRAHAAMNRLLAGQYRLNRLYLPEELKIDDEGREILVRRKDYEGPCVVRPVSDPTIYSDQQRFAQIQWIQARSQVMPQLYKLREVELAALKLIKWADPESLLVDQPQPHELNAVNENLAMVMGTPVSVFPEQNHLSHIKVLCDFMKSPVLGGNPILKPLYLPAAVKHAAQHIAYLYVQTLVRVVEEVAGIKPDQLMSSNIEVKAQLDELFAIASDRVVTQIEQDINPILPLLQQALQDVQQMAPKPPLDPGNAAVQAAAAETNRKAAADQSSTQVKQQQNAIEQERVQVMRENAATAAQTKILTTAADNQTALEIASSRIASGGESHFTNGESLTRQ